MIYTNIYGDCSFNRQTYGFLSRKDLKALSSSTSNVKLKKYLLKLVPSLR